MDAEASILFENWGVLDLGLKTGGVVGPKSSTDGGTIEGVVPRIFI